MKEDCTELFLRYREIARLVWNLGFWPDPHLRDVDFVLAYEEAMARLFEGMVLMRLGYGERVQEYPQGLGKPINFLVTVDTRGANLQVDKYEPGGPGHAWGPVVWLNPAHPYQLKFMAFFDWDQLAPRDYRVLEVLIERLDEYPDLVGRLAHIELEKCSIWLDEQDQEEVCENTPAT
jgi:hypothetical protein